MLSKKAILDKSEHSTLCRGRFESRVRSDRRNGHTAANCPEREAHTENRNVCPLNERDCLPLYREIVRQKFFGLEHHYTNPNVIDGSWFSLTITADGCKNDVTETNWGIKPTTRILQSLHETVSKAKARAASSN